jgi:hypothetical protein
MAFFFMVNCDMSNCCRRKIADYAKAIFIAVILNCACNCCFAQHPTSGILTKEEQTQYMRLFSQLNRKVPLMDSVYLFDTARLRIIRYTNSSVIRFGLRVIRQRDEDGIIHREFEPADQGISTVTYDLISHVISDEWCCGLGPSLKHHAYFKDDKLVLEIYQLSGSFDQALEIYKDSGIVYKYTDQKGIVQIPDPVQPEKMIVIVQDIRELIKAKSYEIIKSFGHGSRKRTLVKIISDSSAKLHHYLQEYTVVFNKADLKAFIKSPKTVYLQLVTSGNNGFYFDDCTAQSFKLYSFVVSVEDLGISEENISDVFFVSSRSIVRSSPFSGKLNSFNTRNKSNQYLKKLLKKNHMDCKKTDGKEIFKDDIILYLNRDKLRL